MRAVYFLVLTAALLLSGCGFHLRGSSTAGSTALTLAIDDRTREKSAGTWLGGGPGELARILTETLADGGVARRDDAGLRIELLNERIEKRVASVDATASAAEYQLDYTLTFRALGADGATVIKESKLKLDRSYRHKADAIMGSAEEEALLQRDMRRDASVQVLRLLRQLPPAVVSAANAATPAPATAKGDAHAPQP
jgi:LPS-assembly lipoprotein